MAAFTIVAIKFNQVDLDLLYRQLVWLLSFITQSQRTLFSLELSSQDL